jgi:thiol-disulfide isomerase/thioredoxin
MKKKLFPILLGTILTCSASIAQAQKVVVNREVETEKDGKMLLGIQLKDQLQKAPYADWYNTEYTGYQTDKKAIAELKKQKLGSYKIIAVIGTWCEDSHRELPRLMKILEEIKYPENKLTLLAVNRKRESPTGEEGLYNIQKVPTFILFKYGKEIGRITEMPKSGWLERDLLEILKKDDKSIKELFKSNDSKK